MNRIDRVTIDGFWGNHRVELNFDPDVNCLIGVNGSGKTTVINIIAAALSADFPTLDRLPFKKLQINLATVGSNIRPSIEVEKASRRASPYFHITYRIKEKASEKYESFSLDELQEERFLRGDIPMRHRQRFLSQLNRGLLAKLHTLINVSWLSIHRSTGPRYLAEERSFESSVDLKVDELNDGLSKYFSMLSKRESLEVEDFQKNIIFSLLTDQTEKAVLSSVKRFDIEREKSALIDIFMKLGFKETRISGRVNRHFDSLVSALDKWEANEAISLPDIMTVVGSFRVHRVVQEWNKLLEKQISIMSPRQNFLRLFNEMLQRKRLEINEKSDMIVVTESGKKFPLSSLSSGEKQLFIILGEALLQEGAPWVYIADEPELSLHVFWQESLIDNLKSINPMAQIIFATHSPDIVGEYGDKVIDMESIIQ